MAGGYCWVTMDNIDASMRAHSKRLGISYATVLYYKAQGWTALEALQIVSGKRKTNHEKSSCCS